MQSYNIVAIFAIVLMVKVIHVSAKKGVSFRRVSLKPPLLLDSTGYKTTYACEGKTLTIICEEGKINLVRANFGRFSISICNVHGNLDWRVNCMSQDSFLIMQNRCELKPNCSVNVSSTTFHDSCPGTLKYLEVQYHCGTGGPLPMMTTTTQSPGLKVTHPTTNVTAIPIGKIHTVTQRSTTTSIPVTSPTIPLVRTSTTPSPNIVSSTMPAFNKSDVFFEHKDHSLNATPKISVTDAVPTIPTFLTNATSERPPTISTTDTYDENYCQPVHSRGINWPNTKVGDTAVLQCPDGASGTGKWHCKDNPVRWSPSYPDLMQCHSLWLEKLKDRVNKFSTVKIQNGDSIISAVSELAVMSATKPVFSDDLKTISELIEEVFYKSINSMENFLDMWHRYHVLRELLMFSVQTLNNLLDSKQAAAWTELQLFDKKKIISTFLEKVDTSALLLSETSSDDSSFSLVKSNVWLSLQVLKIKSQEKLIFPIFSDISVEEDRGYWLNMKDSLLLPQKAIEGYSKNGFYKIVYVAFNKLHNYLKPGMSISHHPPDHSSENVSRIINSRVIGASLDKSGNIKLNQPVVITLKHLIEINVTNPLCVFWDYHLRDWSAQGCWVESSNISHTICLCDHLTNFALIMDLKANLVPTVNADLMYIIITVGCTVAIVSLFITVVILFFRLSLNLSEDSTFIHRNMFLCLLISEFAFLVGIKQTNYHIACSLIAGALQYLFLVTFSWMFFECYHQYITLIRSCDVKKSKSWWYYVAAYAIPGVITGVSAVVDPTSYGTNQFCWLQADNYFVFSFVGPAVSIIFGGLVFLCIALCMLYHNISNTTAVKGKDNANLLKYRSWNRRSLLLVGLLSLTWTSAFVFINVESMGLAYVFSILNSAQGVTILSMYCFQNEKVKEDIRKFFRGEMCFKQTKPDEPQTEPSENVNNENTSVEHDAREFWTLPKEKISASSSNITRDSTPGFIRSSLHDIHQNSTPQNASWMVKGNSNWAPTFYAGKKCNGEQDSVSLNVRRHQALNVKDQGQKYFVPPDLNGQFLDHIYETIDDDALPDEEESKNSFQADQRFPPPENYYGDHSDLSQHSSSSCGYDHQPLITMGPQTGQNLSQIPYPMSKDGHISQHSNGAEQTWEQSHSLRRHRSPSENPISMKPHCDRNPHNFSSENQVCSERIPPETWEPTLPDLLQSPPDSTVVLAVLDGDKVVNRIQQDDVLIKPQYKLSTYC